MRLSTWLYLATRPNYDRIDNDLKYRYIKMQGEATPERISDLENLFEINRDNAKIHQMSKDVEDYERTVQEKATLDEQARLRQLEAAKLNHKAEKLKKRWLLLLSTEHMIIARPKTPTQEAYKGFKIQRLRKKRLN